MSVFGRKGKQKRKRRSKKAKLIPPSGTNFIICWPVESHEYTAPNFPAVSPALGPPKSKGWSGGGKMAIVDNRSAGKLLAVNNVWLTSLKVGWAILVRLITGMLVSVLEGSRGDSWTGQLACWVELAGPGVRAEREKGLGREVKKTSGTMHGRSEVGAAAPSTLRS